MQELPTMRYSPKKSGFVALKLRGGAWVRPPHEYQSQVPPFRKIRAPQLVQKQAEETWIEQMKQWCKCNDVGLEIYELEYPRFI